jgi:hypothetical protein
MNGYIYDVLRHLYAADQVVELRCLNTEKGTVSGYFDDHRKLANVADKIILTMIWSTISAENFMILKIATGPQVTTDLSEQKGGELR